MKTNEELNALKEESEALNTKLAELTEEEMEQVTGGEEYTIHTAVCRNCGIEFTYKTYIQGPFTNEPKYCHDCRGRR